MKDLRLSSLICFYFLSIPFLHAQQLVSSSGEHLSKGDLQLSFTIGESVIETCNINDRILTQGLLQSKLPYVSGEPESLKIDCYPNPAIDYVHVNAESTVEEGLEYGFYDINGNLLKKDKFTANRATIPVREYAPSIYVVKIFRNKKIIRSLKVIKIEP